MAVLEAKAQLERSNLDYGYTIDELQKRGEIEYQTLICVIQMITNKKHLKAIAKILEVNLEGK